MTALPVNLFDRNQDEPLSFHFTTPDSGVPASFAATPEFLVHHNDGTTYDPTNAIITEDVVTGLHRINLPTTNAFYDDNAEFALRIVSGSVGGQSYVGRTIATFSINKEQPLKAWFVATGGNDSNGGRSAGNAFLTLQAAHDAASDGDTIRVGDGLYQPTTVTTISKRVHVIGNSMLGTKIAVDKENSDIKITADGVQLSYLSIQCDRAGPVGAGTAYYCVDASSTAHFKMDHCFLYGFHYAQALSVNATTDSVIEDCIIAGEDKVLDTIDASRVNFNRCRIQNQSNQNDAVVGSGVSLILSDADTDIGFSRCVINLFRTNAEDIMDDLVISEGGGGMFFSDCDLIAGSGDPDLVINHTYILRTVAETDQFVLKNCKLNAHNASIPWAINCIDAEGGRVVLDNCSVIPTALSGEFKNRIYSDAGTTAGF